MKNKSLFSLRFTRFIKRSTIRRLLIESMLLLLPLLLSQGYQHIRIKRITVLQIDGFEIVSKPK